MCWSGKHSWSNRFRYRQQQIRQADRQDELARFPLRGGSCPDSPEAELTSPKVRLAPKQPDHDAGMPYRYGVNVSDGTPLYRRVLSTDPRNTDALYYLTILGGVLAQAEYDRLFALAPDSPRARQLLGDLAVAQERPADAEAQYKAVLQSAPDSLDLLLALGDLTRHQARFEE